MRNILKYPVIVILILSINSGSYIYAKDLSDLNPYLRKSLSWKCTTQDKVVPLRVYYLGGDTGPDGSEVIVYLKNSAWDRTGQESDFSILNDYIQNKFIDRLTMNNAESCQALVVGNKSRNLRCSLTTRQSAVGLVIISVVCFAFGLRAFLGKS